MITVYYDGKCGLCSKEIRYYKTIAPRGIFNWIDITSDPEPLTITGHALNEALKRMHVKDNSGLMHIGVDAFVIIWQAMPYWRVLAYIVSLPVIHSLAGVMYEMFTKWRWKTIQCRVKTG